MNKAKKLKTRRYNTRKNNYIQIKRTRNCIKKKKKLRPERKKETEDRKRAREKKQETKLLEGENMKLKQLAKEKDKGSTKKSRRKQNGGK